MRNLFNSKTLYRKVSFTLVGFTLVLLLAAGVIGIRIGRAQEAPDYRNPNLPVERRVADLLSRMTVEEKVAQITTLWVGKPQQKPHDWSFPDRGDFSPEKAAVVMKHGIGQIARQRERKDARQSAVYANALQKWLKENTRLGIPAMFHDEALPTRKRHECRSGQYFGAHPARNLPADLRGRGEGSRRDERHAFLQ